MTNFNRIKFRASINKTLRIRTADEEIGSVAVAFMPILHSTVRIVCMMKLSENSVELYCDDVTAVRLKNDKRIK